MAEEKIHDNYVRALSPLTMSTLTKFKKYADLRTKELHKDLTQAEDMPSIKEIQGRIKELDKLMVFMDAAKGI